MAGISKPTRVIYQGSGSPQYTFFLLYGEMNAKDTLQSPCPFLLGFQDNLPLLNAPLTPLQYRTI